MAETKHPASAGNDTSRDELGLVFDLVAEGLILHDANGRVTRLNKAALEILGVRERVIESGNYLPDLPFHLSRSLTTGHKSEFNHVFNVVDRYPRTVRVTVSPVQRDSASFVVVSLRDITQEHAATADLLRLKRMHREKAHFLEQILSALPCLVAYVDKNYVYRYTNPVYESWFGLTPEQCLGHALPDVLGPSAFAAIRPYIDGALGGVTQKWEAEVPYRSGTRNVSVTYIPDVGEDGNVLGLFSLVYDISEYVQVKALVGEKERTIHRIINSVPCPIGYWDSQQRSVYANHVYLNYFGFPPETLPGKTMREVLGDVLYTQNLAHIEAALAGEVQSFEREMNCHDGVVRSVLIRYLPDFDDDQVKGFFVIATDVTELKRLEQERRDFEARLINSSKLSSLGEMAGGIAHEINNPLTIISGLATLLKTQVLSGQLQDPNRLVGELDQIDATAHRIAKIIRGLRVFAREVDEDPLEPASFEQIVTETLDLCQTKFRHHGIQVDLKTEMSTRILCRSAQISQILMNLLSNAFDATELHEERWIRITLTSNQQYGILRVYNSGPRIPSQVAEKMMQPFFTTKDVGKGTGLGLSISKVLATGNHAEFNYLSQAEHTCFELKVPLAEPGQD